MPWTPSVAILLLPESELLLQVTLWRELPHASKCKASSGSWSFYLSQYSNHPGIYTIFIPCFPTPPLSFLHFTFPPSILSVCPIASFYFAAVWRWLHASQLSAQTTACIVPLSLLVILTEYTMACLYVYWPRHEDKIIRLEIMFEFLFFPPSLISVLLLLKSTIVWWAD